MGLWRSFWVTLRAMWAMPYPRETAPVERLPGDSWSRKVCP